MAASKNIASVFYFEEGGIHLLRVKLTGSKPGMLCHDHFTTASMDTGVVSLAEKYGLQEDTLVAILPRREVVTRILYLPSQDDSEIESMLSLNVEEYVPLHPEEVLIGHTILIKETGGGSRVLAAFARRERVEELLTRFEQAGLELQGIYLSTACLAAAADAVVSGTPAGAVAHIEPAGIELLLLDEQGTLSGNRILTAPEPLTPESAGAALHEAITTSGNAPGDSSTPVKVLCSTMPGAPLPSGQPGMECAALDEAQLQRSLPGYDGREAFPMLLFGAALIGLGHSALSLNLIPGRVYASRALKAVRGRVQFVAAALLLLLAAGLGLFFQTAHYKQSYIAELEQQFQSVDYDVDSLKEQQWLLQNMSGEIPQEINMLQVLSQLNQAGSAQELSFTQVSFEQNIGVSVWGHARTVDDVHQFTDALRKAVDLFSSAHNVYVNERHTATETFHEYQVSIPFHGEAVHE